MINRIEKIYDLYGLKFLRKILSFQELKYIQKIFNKRLKMQKIATRFAAKEAIIKALPSKKIFRYTQFQVKNLVSGKPFIKIDKSLNEYFSVIKAKKFHLSLSHEKDYAIAFVTITS